MTKLKIKTLLFLFALLMTGGQLSAQLSGQLIVFKGDSVLYLTKSQAVDVANFNLRCDQLQLRFDFATKREQILQELYNQTKAKSEIQDSIIFHLNNKNALCADQIELIQKQSKRATVRTAIVAICIGLIIGVVISN